MTPAPAIHPSILNADQAHLADELDRIADADGLHVDIMDNHFVPNHFGGPSLVETVLAHTALPVDAHLMIENADRWAPAYAEAGAAIVTTHIEATAAPFRLADELHRLGAGAGIALRPTTPLSAVEHLLGRIDLLLLMTVEPGFGGQSFIEAMLPKIERARRLVSEEGLELRIQIDGGVTAGTIERAAEAGAGVFVAGSAVYGADDAPAAVEHLLGRIDLLLLMTVEPGFGGQSFIEAMLPKIERARRLVSEEGLELRIQIDGGVTAGTIERAAEAGAGVFVAGSAVYGADDAPAAIARLRDLAAAHTH